MGCKRVKNLANSLKISLLIVKKQRFRREFADGINELRYCLYNIVTNLKTCNRRAKLAM